MHNFDPNRIITVLTDEQLYYVHIANLQVVFLNSQHFCRQSTSFAARPDSVYMVYAQRNAIKILLLRNLGPNNQLSTLFHSNPLASEQTIIIIR